MYPEVLWRFEILSEQKLFFFPHLSVSEKACVWAFGSSEPGESMLHGQAKWGINTLKRDGGRDCVTGGRSWRLVCTLHRPPRDAPQPWSGKGSLSSCVGRPPASPMPVFTGNLVWLLCSLIMQDRFKMRNLKPTAGEVMTNVSNVAKNEEGARRYTSEYYFTSVPLLQRELNLQQKATKCREPALLGGNGAVSGGVWPCGTLPWRVGVDGGSCDIWYGTHPSLLK